MRVNLWSKEAGRVIYVRTVILHVWAVNRTDRVAITALRYARICCSRVHPVQVESGLKAPLR